MKYILLLALALLLHFGVQAQTSSANTSDTTDEKARTELKPNPAPGSHDAERKDEHSLLEEHELLNSFAVLIFGGCFLLMLVFAKPMQRLAPDQHMKVVLLALIVFAALYLTAAGWTSEQNAPAFGLLGAVLGYLMGKSSGNESPPANP